MNYYEAKKIIRIKRLITIFLYICFGTVLLTSVYRYIQFVVHEVGSTLPGDFFPLNLFLAQIQKALDVFPLSLAWEFAAPPNLKNPWHIHNFQIAAYYLLCLVGTGVWSSANALAERLRKIDIQIEDEAIKESLQGKTPRSVQTIRNQVIINMDRKEKWFSRFHVLYLAPLLIGIVLWIIEIAEKT